MSKIAAIILTGGQSRRMGRPKADLRLGGETFLKRAVRLLSTVTSPVIISAAPDQIVPEFDARVVVERDTEAGCGPLHGFVKGLGVVPKGTEFAYLSAVDTPYFSPAWLDALTARIGDRDAAVGIVAGLPSPVGALYRCESVRPAAEKLLASGVRRLSSILTIVEYNSLSEEELRRIDPDLSTFLNVNTPDEYQRARELLGEGPANPRNGE